MTFNIFKFQYLTWSLKLTFWFQEKKNKGARSNCYTHIAVQSLPSNKKNACIKHYSYTFIYFPRTLVLNNVIVNLEKIYVYISRILQNFWASPRVLFVTLGLLSFFLKMQKIITIYILVITAGTITVLSGRKQDFNTISKLISCVWNVNLAATSDLPQVLVHIWAVEKLSGHAT